jgi:hypothetical protein
MEILIRSRIIILIAFVLALLVVIICSYKELKIAYMLSGFIFHILLFFFLITESFGRISRQRHMALRVIARVVLLLTGFTIMNITFYSIIAIFS